MAKFPPGDLTVFLDDGGVLNDTERRIAEWGRLTRSAGRLQRGVEAEFVTGRQDPLR